jgi:hypothetical protein
MEPFWNPCLKHVVTTPLPPECKIAIRPLQQGQIMLANQRVCLHFASLTNKNAWNSRHINKRSEKITPCSTPSVPFVIKLFTPKLTNSDKACFLLQFPWGDFLNSI